MQSTASKVLVARSTLSQSSAALSTGKLRQGRGLSAQHVTRTVAGLLVSAALVGCCQPNDPNCQTQRIGPSGAEVFGIAIGVGAAAATGIAIAVHHAHHTLKGCVTDAPGGLQLQKKGDTSTYMLTGSTNSVKAGDRVSLHGKKEKQMKGSTAPPQFNVEHEDKDYGPCTPTPAAAASAP